MSLLIFQQNEKTFQSKAEEFQKSFARFGMTNQDQKKVAVEKLRLLVTELEAQIKYMEIECGSSNAQQKNSLLPKIRKYKQEFQESKKKFQDLENNFLDYQAKQNVLGGQDGKSKQQDMIQNDKLINNNLKMMGQTNQLLELHGVANETEKAAIGISTALYEQKKLMMTAIDDTDEINRDLGLTNRQITIMRNKEKFNKLILVAVIIILTFGNLLLLYYRFTT